MSMRMISKPAAQPNAEALRKNLVALDEILRETPENTDARMRKARSHRMLGEDDRAVEEYEIVLKLLHRDGFRPEKNAVLQELKQIVPKHRSAIDTASAGLQVLDPEDLEASLVDESSAMDATVVAAIVKSSPIPVAPRPIGEVFGTVTPAAFQAIEDRLVRYTFNAGDTLFSAGERADGCFFLGSAKVRIDGPVDNSAPGGSHAQPPPLFRHSPRGVGEVVGASGFFKQSIRCASATCVAPGDVYFLKTSAIEALTRQFPSVQQTLRKVFACHFVDNFVVALATHYELPPRFVSRLRAAFVEREHLAGETLVTSDDDRSGLWLVVSGSASVRYAERGPEEVPVTLCHGSILGTFGKNPVSGASISATEPMSTMLLPSVVFDSLCRQVGRETLSSRLNAAGATVTPSLFFGAAALPLTLSIVKEPTLNEKTSEPRQ